MFYFSIFLWLSVCNTTRGRTTLKRRFESIKYIGGRDQKIYLSRDPLISTIHKYIGVEIHKYIGGKDP